MEKGTMGKENMSKKTRTVLVILSNRFNPSEKPIYYEVIADENGTILSQKKLRSEPKRARFDEVWMNDEGKKQLEVCLRMKRIYRHKLEKPRQ